MLCNLVSPSPIHEKIIQPCLSLPTRRLRNKAHEALGDKFDVREFHDIVLANGAVPMTILEELVDQYIATSKA